MSGLFLLFVAEQFEGVLELSSVLDLLRELNKGRREFRFER